MGGDKARTQATAEAPVTPDPKKKNARGAFYGVGTIDPGAYSSLGSSDSSRRGAFLGG